jgi:hypothetical protein
MITSDFMLLFDMLEEAEEIGQSIGILSSLLTVLIAPSLTNFRGLLQKRHMGCGVEDLRRCRSSRAFDGKDRPLQLKQSGIAEQQRWDERGDKSFKCYLEDAAILLQKHPFYWHTCEWMERERRILTQIVCHPSLARM